MDTRPTSYLIILLKATTTHQSKSSIKDKSKADIAQACTKSLVCSLSRNVNPTQTVWNGPSSACTQWMPVAFELDSISLIGLLR